MVWGPYMQKEIMITREQFFEFIKKNGDTADQVCRSTKHYLDYFDKYKATGKKDGWNWSAIFPMWLFYRKMYISGFVTPYILGFLCLILAIPVLGILNLFMQFFGLDSSLLFLAVPFILIPGVYVCYMKIADYIYLRFASQRISIGILNRGVSIFATIIATIFWSINVLLLFLS